MGAITITDLIGAFDSDDMGIRRDGNGDAGKQINAAFAYIASLGIPNGRLYMRPGTYNIVTSIVQPANVELMGAGAATILRLAVNALVDVWTANGVSNVRLRNLKIDGNRANNGAGTRNGIWLENVTDALIEDVEVINARADGIWANNCVRPVLVRVSCHDNGRNGICLSYCQNHQIIDARCYDNCRVTTAGNADGIRFELLSSDGSLTNPHCYETALAGQLHGYGIREAAGEGCYRNSVWGGSQEGNLTGRISLESRDSIAFTTSTLRYLSANAVNPT